MASTSLDKSPDSEFDARVNQLVDKRLAEWLNLPNEFKTSLSSWLELNPPLLPISQIAGYIVNAPQAATPVATQQTTASTTPTDLATAGPSLTGLPDGQYLIGFGASIYTSAAGAISYMGVKVNSTEPVAGDAAQSTTADANAGSRWIVKSLTNGGNNTLLARYWAQATFTAGFYNRWLVAIRMANV